MKRPAVSRPAAPPRPAAFDYPDSDGQPIAETDFQRRALWYANDVLARRYRDHPDVYVSANLFVYSEKLERRAVQETRGRERAQTRAAQEAKDREAAEARAARLEARLRASQDLPSEGTRSITGEDTT